MDLLLRAAVMGSLGNIPSQVRATAEQFADAEAVVENGIRMTYRDLTQAVMVATRAVIGNGLDRGDAAAIWAPNGCQWIVAALGILGAGGVIVPVNTRYKSAEVYKILRKTRARILFADDEFLGLGMSRVLREWLDRSGEELPDLERIVVWKGHSGTSWEEYIQSGATQVSDADALARIGSIGPSDLCDVLFTSGTTGQPKGAVSSHGQVLRLYDEWSRIVELGPGERHLVASPFSHSFGYKAGWLVSLLRGATVLPVPRFDADAVLRIIDEEGVTFLPGPPALLQDLLSAPRRSAHDLTSLRATVTGASAIPVDLVLALKEDLGFTTVITGYGLTETNGPVTISRPADDMDTVAHFCGRALPGTELMILRADGEEAEPGELGEVLVGGYQVTLGYFDDPGATAAAIDPSGWFHTGDLGLTDERGYLQICGRRTEKFIVGGFNVHPEEVEGQLLCHEKVAEAAVVGVPDGRLGEVGVAFVVPVPDVDLSAEELTAWSREHMANYKVPRYMEICASLPTTSLGKIARDELRRRWAARNDSVSRREVKA